MVLTVHLKRFTPAGRKIGGAIAYPENLKLGPYMSHAGMDPTYKFYGVINHSGGGPHSGHYTAHVKAPSGQWHSMNDSSVTPCNRAPLNNSNAYVLFYCREQGSALRDAIYAPVAGPSKSSSSTPVNGQVKSSSNPSKKSRASDPGPGLDRMNMSKSLVNGSPVGHGLGEPVSRKRAAEEREGGISQDEEDEWQGIPTSDLTSPVKKTKLSNGLSSHKHQHMHKNDGDDTSTSASLSTMSPKQLRKLERKRQRSQSSPQDPVTDSGFRIMAAAKPSGPAAHTTVSGNGIATSPNHQGGLVKKNKMSIPIVGRLQKKKHRPSNLPRTLLE